MLIGIDEAGRGPVLGPMVVAGVIIDDESKLVALQVKDSKKLTPARREFLAGEIGKVARWELKIVPAEDIDQLRALMTMNELEAKLFASIIETLEPPEDTMIFVDSADADENNFKALIRKELRFEADIVSKHKADEMYPVVSAASIIAKTRRDGEVERIGKDIGRDIGSGYPSDETTIKFIENWIEEHGDLPPHTRRSWETARRLMSLHKVKRF